MTAETLRTWFENHFYRPIIPERFLFSPDAPPRSVLTVRYYMPVPESAIKLILFDKTFSLRSNEFTRFDA